MEYQVGDVVLAYIPFEDGTGSKPRPVVILKTIPEKERFVVAECYSDKEHYPKNFGILIKEGSKEYIAMGIKQNTFITKSIKGIFKKMIIEKWGYYPDIEYLKNKLR